MNKRVRLPKEAFVGDEQPQADDLIDSGDVEGHGLPTTAPPSLMRRGGGHGGEAVPKTDDEGDDVEGHVVRQ
jgi:hypothetical protein